MTKTIQRKTAILLIIVISSAAFQLGRSTAPAEIIKVKETETSKTKEKRRIVVVKDPNGKETTTVDEEIDKDVNKTKETTQIVNKKPRLNVSVLASVDTSDSVLKPVYGLSVNKEVLGPITAGAFALTNGTVGLSVGLNF